MKPEPAVTVVIPTYNRREFVIKAAQSVLSQSFDDLRLVVVDDGGDDLTPEALASEFCDPRLVVIRQENLGVSAARNAGARVAKGDFIAFLDSDDLWKPEKLAFQVRAMKENPEAALCYTGEVWFRRGKWANPCSHHSKFTGDIFGKCLPLCIISPSSALIRRGEFEALGGFDETLPCCEDYDLWLRITARHGVVFLEEKLIIKQNGHEGQLSATHWAQDRYRVAALWKVALDKSVSAANRRAALEFIVKKSAIVSAGAAKRGETSRAEVFAHSEREARKWLSTL